MYEKMNVHSLDDHGWDEAIDTKITRFDEAVDRIESWLNDSGILVRSTTISVRDRTRRYCIRFNIGTDVEPFSRVARTFWEVVADQLPLESSLISEIASPAFNPNSLLKRAGRSWIVVVDPFQPASSSALPSYEYWCGLDEGRKINAPAAVKKNRAGAVHSKACARFEPTVDSQRSLWELLA